MISFITLYNIFKNLLTTYTILILLIPEIPNRFRCKASDVAEKIQIDGRPLEPSQPRVSFAQRLAEQEVWGTLKVPL